MKPDAADSPIRKYKVTIVETVIYDAYVEAKNLDDAKDAALANPKCWYKDVNASDVVLGEDHCVMADNGIEWRRA